ncbi:MAG: alpha-ribazole phosphatase [Bacillota bacterium]
MTRLFLVRHGRTAWNAAGRFTGQMDLPLDEAGRAQAEALAELLAGVEFDLAITSDLTRAEETARRILAGRKVPLFFDPRLREASFGRWEGRTYAEIAAEDPVLLKTWEDDPERVAPPGGESLADLAARVGTVLAEVLREHEGATVLFVTHGGPARVLLCLVLGVPLERHWQFGLGNGGLAILEFYDREGILMGLWNPPFAPGLTKTCRELRPR